MGEWVEVGFDGWEWVPWVGMGGMQKLFCLEVGWKEVAAVARGKKKAKFRRGSG